MKKKHLILIAIYVGIRLGVWQFYSSEHVQGDEAFYSQQTQRNVSSTVTDYFYPQKKIKTGSRFPYSFNRNPTFFDPLYPLFLSVLETLSSDNRTLVNGVQLLLGVLILLMGMELTSALYPKSKAAPILYGVIQCLHIPFVCFFTRKYSENVDAFIGVLLLYLFYKLFTTKRSWLVPLNGLVLGLWVLIKSYLLTIWVPFLGLIVFFAYKVTEPKRRPLVIATHVLLFSGLFWLVVTPFLIRTHNFTGTYQISSKTSYNLWKDNNNFSVECHDWREWGCEKKEWLMDHSKMPDPDNLVRPFCEVPIAEQYACEKKGALGFFFDDPIRFFKRGVIKVMNFWSPNSYVMNPYDANKRFGITDKGLIVLIWYTFLVSYTVLFLSLVVGLFVPSQSDFHRYFRWGLCALLLYVSAILCWGHGLSRLRMPYMQLCVLLSVGGMVYLKETLVHLFGKLRLRTCVFLVLFGACLVLLIHKAPRLVQFPYDKKEHSSYYFGPTFPRP